MVDHEGAKGDQPRPSEIGDFERLVRGVRLLSLLELGQSPVALKLPLAFATRELLELVTGRRAFVVCAAEQVVDGTTAIEDTPLLLCVKCDGVVGGLV